MLLVNNEERTGKISDIHSIIIENRDDIEIKCSFVCESSVIL